jgi:hypothetical protein
MDMVQKLFQKYQTLPTSSIGTLFPDPNARFTERHSPDMKPPTDTGKHTNEKCGLHWKQRNKRQYVCAMAVMFL